MDDHRNLNAAALVDDPSLAAEIQALGDKLAARGSVTAFARGFALLCLSVIGLGVAGRLLAESARLPFFFWPIAVVGLSCLAGALLSAVTGGRLQAVERADFDRYRQLRARAGIDA